jgi:2-aminoethylphosphonate-pyruvate transaminase
MQEPTPSSRNNDKLLFTPGPLTTSLGVKQAMLHDAGSWHYEFNELVRDIRSKLIALAGLTPADGHEVVLMQGSGTFGVESVIGSVIPPQGKLLVIANGAYGERIAQMAVRLGIQHQVLRFAEDTPADPAAIDRALAEDASLSHVAVVHCETTTGLLNPVEAIGRDVQRRQRVFIVDAMSSFGALPIDLKSAGVAYLISSPNKCFEGVPGFSFVFAQRKNLLATAGWARSLSLDLLGQWQGFEKNGQFRYTPPTHSILAFAEALRELEAEGGVAARRRRYEANHRCLLEGMKAMGFRTYLSSEALSCIITAFHSPPDPGFEFSKLYRGLSERGFIIYPGKLTQAETFRIGTIGRIFESDIARLLVAVRECMQEMADKSAGRLKR